MLKSINPKNGKLIGEFAYSAPSQIEKQLSSAFSEYKASFHMGEKLHFNRLNKIGKLIPALQKHEQKLAESMADEMGKPIVQGKAEV